MAGHRDYWANILSGGSRGLEAKPVSIDNISARRIGGDAGLVGWKCYSDNRREDSEAPTAIRIKAWGARSSTSALGLVFAGLYNQRSDVEHEQQRRRRGGAPVFRRLEDGEAGGGWCSRAPRILGGRWLAERVKEKAGTATTRARPWQQKEWRWWLVVVAKREGKREKWVHLVEANMMAQGLGLQSCGRGDRPVAAMAGHEKRERERELGFSGGALGMARSGARHTSLRPPVPLHERKGAGAARCCRCYWTAGPLSTRMH
uniref:Uncharacterized protein n=1 Tax=Oryza sativa subsp. japonica TaxID=39947 RepID=Q2R335_ORYSJ|nr:hypothetical protein LOC_Os11g33280 [Oryza sativa Japonica Group]